MLEKRTLSLIDLIKLSLRIFKTKPTRMFLTILGMAIGISTVVFLVSFGYGLQYILIGKMVTTEDSLVTLSATYPVESGLGIDQNKINEIKSMPDVSEVSPIAEFSGELKFASSTGLLPIIRVVDPSSVFRLLGSNPDIGRHLEVNKDEIVLSGQALQLMGMPIDKTVLGKTTRIKIHSINLDGSTQDTTIDKDLAIVGVISDEQQPPLAIISNTEINTPIAIFKELLVKAKDINTVTVMRDILEKQGFLISARIDLVNQAKKITNIITTTLAVFGVTALTVSAIGMFNTMLISFIERTYEVGVMKAIGATDSNVRDLFIMESAVIGTLGGGGGIVIGVALGKIINFGLNVLATHLGGKTFDLFILPVWFGMAVLILSVVIGIIAGFWPAYRASKISPRSAFIKK